jgi:hypothetical protein
MSQAVTITNVGLLHRAMKELEERPSGLPGLGVMHGYSGYGKSMAASWCHNRHRSYFVQCQSTWNRKYFLETILLEMGITPGKTLPVMTNQIATELLESQRPLIVDEADWLAEKHQNAMMIMDIFEASQTPIILIGEERLPSKLSHFEKIHNRILTWVPAQPCSLSDLVQLSGLYANGITIEEPLLMDLLAATKGVTRRASTSLANIRHWAANKGIDVVTRENYDGGFFTSQPPRGRS